MFKQKKPVYAPMLSTFGGGSVRGFGGGGAVPAGGGGIVYPDPTYTSQITTNYKQVSNLYSTAIGTLTNEDGTKFWTGAYNTSNEFITWTGNSSWSSTPNDWSAAQSSNFLSKNGYTSQERPSHGFWFNDGSSALISGVDSGNVFTVSCSTAYDLSTGTYDDVENSNWYAAKLQATGSGGGWAFPNSDCSIIVGKGYTGSMPVSRTSLSTAGDLSSAGSGTTLMTGSTWDITSIAGADCSPDGRMIVDIPYSGGNTKILDLGEGKDIWTATTTDFANATFNTTSPLYVLNGDNSISGLKFDWYNQAGLTNGKMRFFVTRTNLTSSTQLLGIGEWPILT